MLAVTNGNSELAQLLVDHDAQVDCTDKHLRTALHRAVSKSVLAIISRFVYVGNWMIRIINHTLPSAIKAVISTLTCMSMFSNSTSSSKCYLAVRVHV